MMFKRGSRSFFVVLAAIAALSLPLSASAVPITGTIGFGGSFSPTGGTDLSDATGIDFSSAFVLDTTGDFTAIPDFTAATFTDFVFDPLGAPVEPLWSVGFGASTFSFALDQILVDLQSATQLNLSGSGTLMGAGFDPTAGNWTFSGNSAGSIIFTFSSITTATSAVPEPGLLVLLGLGLPLIGAVRRRTFDNKDSSGEK